MTPRERPAQSRRPRLAAILVMAALLTGLAASAAAQSISYTVQVVALSDRDAALGIQSDLLRQGFPAYVVRSTSAQGDVFRVRVGAFANRPASLLYAEAMPQVAGGQPVPALAEAIPTGVTPLAPRLVLQQEVGGLDVRLLRLGGDLVVRAQQRTPLAAAEYSVLSGGSVERLRAWQLSETEAGARVWVRDMPLWPDTWQDDSEEVRAGYMNSLIGLVADRLGLDPAAVTAAQYGGAAGVPRLIVVERVVPGGAEPELLGLGLPDSGMTPAGPLRYLGLEATDLPGLPDGVRIDLATGSVRGELVRPPSEAEAPGEGADVGPEAPPESEGAAPEGEGEAGAEAPAGGAPAEPAPEEEAPEEEAPHEEAPEEEAPHEEAPEEEAPHEEAPQEGAPAEGAPGEGPPRIVGDGWTATPDGPFVRLTVAPAFEGGSPSSWRAAFGAPLWSSGDYLLAFAGQTLLIYDFLPRP